MKVLGVVAEYNPMHNGHLYHIEKAKSDTGSDAVVCVMSGDYVQRGEPACLDKWQRADIAIRNGIDAVFEIPTFACLSNASVYASVAISMLESFGMVDVISFGSETGSLDILSKVAERLDNKKLQAAIRKKSLLGFSYPRAREQAYLHIFDDEIGSNVLKNPNDILAVEYIKNIKKCDMHTVKRNSAGYAQCFDEKFEFQSATGIREAVSRELDIGRYVPDETLAAISGIDLESLNLKLLDLLKYKIIYSDSEAIDCAPQGGEGIGNLLLKNIYSCRSMDELILAAKSKRYTYTHISRLLMQILLHIDRNEFMHAKPKYLRILAANEIGRKLIKSAKKNNLNSVPIITNINKEKNILDGNGLKQLQLDIKAADTYNILAKNDMYVESDYIKMPSML